MSKQKNHSKIRVTLILLFSIYLLGQWNWITNNMFLETCSSMNDVAYAACGNESEYYGRGRLYDSAADVFLVPTRLIYLPLSNIKSIFALSEFRLDFPILQSTYFVPNEARSVYIVTHLVIQILQLIYCFFLARVIQWAWQKKDWPDSVHTMICASICIVFLYWLLPFSRVLLPLVYGAICLSVILVLYSIVQKRISS